MQNVYGQLPIPFDPLLATPDPSIYKSTASLVRTAVVPRLENASQETFPLCAYPYHRSGVRGRRLNVSQHADHQP